MTEKSASYLFKHGKYFTITESDRYLSSSDEELRLETSALEIINDGHVTLSTQMIKPNYHRIQSSFSEGNFRAKIRTAAKIM